MVSGGGKKPPRGKIGNGSKLKAPGFFLLSLWSCYQAFLLPPCGDELFFWDSHSSVLLLALRQERGNEPRNPLICIGPGFGRGQTPFLLPISRSQLFRPRTPARPSALSPRSCRPASTLAAPRRRSLLLRSNGERPIWDDVSEAVKAACVDKRHQLGWLKPVGMAGRLWFA